MKEDFREEFLRFAIEEKVLGFGEFVTKAGRLSPYFFNAGLFNHGASLLRLGDFYAKAVAQSDLKFDMIFGPAYKGIVLAAAISMGLAKLGHDYPFAYNRKEKKDHGEGGVLVGAPLKGKVLIVDDVISAGTSVRESVEMIRAEGAEPAGVVISLDRMEKGKGEKSAIQEVESDYGIPVVAIATLRNLLDLLEGDNELGSHFDAVKAYREKYGVD